MAAGIGRFGSWAKLAPFLGLGAFFGIVLSASQAISWYRIQEMFRFQSFHMYGIIGSAVAVAAASLWLLRRFGAHDIEGHSIAYQTKQPSRYRYWLGGGLFGMGWGLTGACPGPIFALIGHGIWSVLIVLAAALMGTWFYSAFRVKLPH